MSQLVTLIVSYAKSLPAWQKVLAKLAFDLARSVSETESEIEIALLRLKIDNGLVAGAAGDAEIKFIDELVLEDTDSAAEVAKLKEIRDCKNINALDGQQKITFAPKLTIIYGENGSGKSGYSRVLNSAFYSRGDKTILPNVLKPKQEQGDPSAVIEFDVGGTAVGRLFPQDILKPEFRCFACFDSKTVLVHLEDSNELYVVPKEMAFFERLATSMNIVSKKLTQEILSKKKPNGFPTYFDGESPLKLFVTGLSENSEQKDLDARMVDIAAVKTALGEAQKKLFEHKAIDPKAKVTETTSLIADLKDFSASLTQAAETLNALIPARLTEAIKAFSDAKTESSKTGANSFKTDLLGSVGSEQWKSFLEAMHALSEEEGKKRGKSFPQAGDSCPACRQSLSNDAIALFERYFAFLKGEAEKKLAEKKKAIQELYASISKLAVPELSNKPKLFSWLEANHADSKNNLVAAATQLGGTKTAAIEAAKGLDVNGVPARVQLGVAPTVKALEEVLNSALKSFNDVEFKKKLKTLESEEAGLRHGIILTEKSKEISGYVADLKWAKKAAGVAGAISTRGATEKQKSIFEEYFSKQYRQLFFKEASNLKVNFQIDVKPKGTLGKTVRKLEILDHSPEKVLSEGEQHAIALADFLTEVAICNLKGGLIFDDPVNSLDHERKAYIASRLVSESHKRQIVIFTHDISFLFDLVNEAERQGLKEKTDLFCHWVQRLEDTIGLVSLGHRRELESDYKAPTRAEDHWKEAKKEADPGKREATCKQGFDCLRKTYEAFVLSELFGGTVTRFDRRMKYDTLKRIYCPKEAAQTVFDRLSYCSGFVSAHLQADGYSGEVASPDLLKREIDVFIEFKRKFLEEKKQALQGQT